MRARECGCPDWAEQCAHFDGAILILASMYHECPEGKQHFGKGSPYGVAMGSGFGGEGQSWRQNANGKIFRAQCSCPGLLLPQLMGGFDTLDAARDEFRRREAELLGREA